MKEKDFGLCSIGFSSLLVGYMFMKFSLVDSLYINGVLMGTGIYSIGLHLRDSNIFKSFFLNKIYNYKKVSTKELLLGTNGFNNVTVPFNLENSTMLIAGQRGAGKSSLLKSLILNLLKNYKKNELQLALIDLKSGVEFSIFRKFKHVKYFATTIEDTKDVLSAIEKEMELRYKKFYSVGVSNFQEYKNFGKMAKLILIIDEYSLVHLNKEATQKIENIMALSRACDIGVIIATQRPDSKIINGRIKCNLDYIVGMKVLDRINADVIGIEGLEKLKGKGHAILKLDKLIEFKSFYILNDKIKKI